MKIEKRVIVIIIALGCGILAVLLTKIYIKQKIGQREAEIKGYLGETAIVLVADKNIARGTAIKDNMVALKKIPSNFAQPNVLTSIESALGKIAAADMSAGEQILRNKITSREMVSDSPGSSLATKTPAGKRAITISIDSISAVGGMVSAGDYVDVIGDFPIPQQVQGKTVTQLITVTLFQNILVLDVGGGKATNVVTLALNPQEAAFLNYAQQQGKIRLLLRPPLETETLVLPPVSVDTFWAEIMHRAGIEVPIAAPAPEVVKPSVPSNVEVYRGPKKEDVPLK